jgi:hypothetical protein
MAFARSPMVPLSRQSPLKVVQPPARMPAIGLQEQSTPSEFSIDFNVESHLCNRLASAIADHHLQVVPQLLWQIVTWFAEGIAQSTAVARIV